MPLDVVAVPRSHSVVLAAVVGATESGAKLHLIAEDGARFRFPADRALVRCAGLLAGGPEADVRGLLAAVRARIPPFDDWLALHAQVGEGGRADVRELARAAALPGDEGALAVALGALRAEPWFRRDGIAFEAVPMRQALERLYQIHDRVFREAGDAAVRSWWPGRLGGVPDGWQDPGGEVGERMRSALERARFFELDYVPAEDVAAGAALAALTSWALGGDVSGDGRGKELARTLGLPDDPDQVLEELIDCGAVPADVEPAPHRAGLTGPFPEEALAQAGTVPAEPLGAGREDLTHEFAVAVDDADTREVDDALTVRRDGDDVVLLVHIADVARAVAPGTPLDAAVRHRASSLFLPDHSVLMFPPELVVERLSLAVGEPRAALTGVFRLAPDGHVRAARFTRSMVRLARRVEYEDTRDPTALGPDGDTGRLLVRIGEALRVARERRGARILRLPSQKVTVEDGVPQVALRLQDTPGDVVVSEAMVLHNTQAGEALAAAGVPALYRGQSGALPEGREVPEPGDALYAPLIKRTFAPTETSVEPLEHAGLGAPAYVQCTSPMRRYTDLLNQRQLAAAAHGEPPPHARDEVAALVAVLHERERAVRHAADARTQYWVARAVAESGRDTLRGVLAKAPRRGLGAVWVPELCRELPLRAPRAWRAPPVGVEAEWRVAAVRPLRGRIELAPTDG